MVIGVTGGTGFIGQCLLREYCTEHRFIVLHSHELTGEHIRTASIDYIVSDYSFESMKNDFSGCDAILHLGGLLSTGEREQSILNYAANISSAESVFGAAKELGIRNVVNISSRLVYDPEMPSPHSEDEKPVPVNVYGIVKLAIENLAAMYNRRNELSVKSLRLAEVFGRGGRSGYMMSVFTEKCERGEALEVFDKQGKELLYVKDAARAIMTACCNEDAKGVFNIGSGVFHTNMQIAQAFCEAYDNKEMIIDKSKDDEVTKVNHMNVTKASEVLGFKTGFSLTEAIIDMRKEPEK